MGNWRTVQIVGTCAVGDVPALRTALSHDLYGPDTGQPFHCLMNGGLFGLPMWAGERISAVGNLAERDCGLIDVAQTLEELAVVAPSLAVVVHVGGEREAKEVVATITLAGGRATIGPPQIDVLPEISQEQMLGQLYLHLSRQRGPS